MNRGHQAAGARGEGRGERGSAPARLNEYFIDGEGIHRQVLQAEICKFLGVDATCRPGEFEGRKGFKIKAIRPFTSAMIKDLQTMSEEYESEARAFKQKNREEMPYVQSQTRKRNDPTLDDPRDREYRHGSSGYQTQSGSGGYDHYEQEAPYAHQQGYNQPQAYGGQGYQVHQYQQAGNYPQGYTMAPPGGPIPAPVDARGYPPGDPMYSNYVYSAQSPMGGQGGQGGYYPPPGREPPRGTREEAPQGYYTAGAPGGRGRGDYGDTPMGGVGDSGPYGAAYGRPPNNPYETRDPYAQPRRR